MSEPFHVFLDGRCEPEESFAHLNTAREFASSYTGTDTEVMICEQDHDGLWLVNDDGTRVLIVEEGQ